MTDRATFCRRQSRGMGWEGIAAQRAMIRDPRRDLLDLRVIEQVQEHSDRSRGRAERDAGPGHVLSCKPK